MKELNAKKINKEATYEIEIEIFNIKDKNDEKKTKNTNSRTE